MFLLLIIIVYINRTYCSRVYRTVKGGGITYTAESFGGDYLCTLTLSGIPNTVTNLRVELRPFGAAVRNGDLILYENYFTRTVVLNTAK